MLRSPPAGVEHTRRRRGPPVGEAAFRPPVATRGGRLRPSPPPRRAPGTDGARAPPLRRPCECSTRNRRLTTSAASVRRLTLSFDNGPDPECTPAVLDALRQRGIRASFFVCARGNRLHPALPAASPEGRRLLERARNEGHWIGSHGLSHCVELGTTRDPAVVEREISGNQERLGELLDRRLFRPYMGGGVRSPRAFCPEAVEHLCDGGYTVVLWNCVPRDWERPESWPEAALAEIGTRDWTLLVAHDVGRYGGMRHLDRFLDEAQLRGVEFVQDFPPECVPIREGRLVGSLEGMVCGDEPEPIQPLAAAAADQLWEGVP